MPVVPFSPTPPPSAPKAREFTPADEPWLLMAAAQMDADGRLVESENTTPTLIESTTDGS